MPSHVGTGIGDDKLSSGMNTAWCLGLGVRCHTFACRRSQELLAMRGPFDHKLVACTFAGVKSPWCGASLVSGVALSTGMLGCVFHG